MRDDIKEEIDDGWGAEVSDGPRRLIRDDWRGLLAAIRHQNTRYSRLKVCGWYRNPQWEDKHYHICLTRENRQTIPFFWESGGTYTHIAAVTRVCLGK